MINRSIVLLLITNILLSQKPKLINITLGHYNHKTNHITIILLTKNTTEIIYNNQKFSPDYIQGKYQTYKIKIHKDDKHKFILKNEKKRKIIKKKLYNPRSISLPRDRFTFHTGSCMIKYPFHLRWYNARVWCQILKNIAKDSANFHIWLGDNVYLLSSKDVWFVPNHLKNEKRMFKRYVVYRRSLPVKKLLSARPNYAIWDDHDFGPDNSGTEYKDKNITLKLFKNFWGNPYFGTKNVPGTFFSIELNKTLIICFDERYYRTTNTEAKEKFIIGPEQMKWFEEQLKKNSPKLLIICSSSQILNPWKNPNMWSYYEKEKKQLFEIIKKNKIPNVIILSGDRHRAEVLKDDSLLPFPVYEFTISPLTSFIRYKWLTPEEEKNIPQREGELMTFYNYATCEVNWEAPKPYFQIQIKNRRSKVKYSKKILLRN